MSFFPTFGTVVIGGGPAGLAPLVWAARHGLLPLLARDGLVVVERGQALGSGAIGDYGIGSDTLADTFLECLDGIEEPRLVSLQAHPTTEALRAYKGGPAPLPLVATFLAALGAAMQGAIEAAGGTVLLGHEALSARRSPDGGWLTTLRARGSERTIASRYILLATGGLQNRDILFTTPVAGRPLLPDFADRLMLSSEVLGLGGANEVMRRLVGRAAPQVTIIGGSHSAVATANLLLHRIPGLDFGAGAITLLHRRPLRIFYPSAEAARQDGYTDFSPEDVCPLTGRLFRLAGFRLEARELVMRALGIGGRPPEPRLCLHHLTGETEGRGLIERADLVIAALGYRPRALHVLQADGRELALLASGPGDQPLVNSACQVLDAQRQPVPGLLGIGLAAGFVPQGGLGGEPSFRGQTNGLWLWQNPVGAIVAQALLNRSTDLVAA
jgi:hypothetical protein